MENQATTIQPQATTIPQSPDALDLSALPLWQRQYISARAAGLSEQDAELHARVSKGTVLRYLDSSPSFANAYARVESGIAVVGAEELRARAQSYGAVALDDAFKESRAKELAPRDRLGNRRLVLEAAGAVGQGQGAVSVNITNTGNLLLQLDQRRRQGSDPAAAPVPGG